MTPTDTMHGWTLVLCCWHYLWFFWWICLIDDESIWMLNVVLSGFNFNKCVVHFVFSVHIYLKHIHIYLYAWACVFLFPLPFQRDQLFFLENKMRVRQYYTNVKMYFRTSVLGNQILKCLHIVSIMALHQTIFIYFITASQFFPLLLKLIAWNGERYGLLVFNFGWYSWLGLSYI